MTAAGTDAALIEHVECARNRTLDWLSALQAPGRPAGVLRVSAVHDPERWPGVLLPGTYDSVMTRTLIGGALPPTAADTLADWLESFRLADGRFRIPGMADDAVFKKPDREETWRYVDFHVTNYALGAMAALAPGRAPELGFVRPFLDPSHLGWWLSHRDLRDPWQEGNNVVNLGGFLFDLQRFGDGPTGWAAAEALRHVFDWHDRLQEPTSGFWGVGQHGDPERLLHAFAGSMHNYHLFYAAGRPIPHHARAVDYVLSLPPEPQSACLDVDAADLLVHAAMLVDHRRDDGEAWLRTLLPGLLDLQNGDGGFYDVERGIRRLDGWVDGYSEPQGLSNTFATFFRWIAIALIADRLWPGRWPWRFRRGVGIGYRMPCA
ncbi:MAG: hypothetical protein AAFX81_05315 [Pseudomonadota bacterium]